MVKQQKTKRYSFWAMADKFSGYPKLADFSKEERDLKEPEENEYLLEAIAWSVDPFNRTYADTADPKVFGEGYCMVGFQLAKVTASRNPELAVGDVVVGQFGWRSPTVVQAAEVHRIARNIRSDPIDNFPPNRLADLHHLVQFGPDIPQTYALGVFGITGISAFYSVIDVCRVRPNDAILINAAAGAVGSIACQIAKIKGCTVIGVCGSEEKTEWLQSVGVDCAVNYNSRTFDLRKAVDQYAPNGLDAFLDLVGGELAAEVYPLLRQKAIVCQVGNSSAYNAPEKPKVSDVLNEVIRKEIIISGFNVSTYGVRLKSAVGQLAKWIQEGRLKVHETIYRGFDQLPMALIDQMDGKNVGKVIVTAE